MKDPYYNEGKIFVDGVRLPIAVVCFVALTLVTIVAAALQDRVLSFPCWLETMNGLRPSDSR